MSLLSIVQDHCRIHALNIPTSVIGSQDAAIVQILGILNDVVENLIDESNWQAFTMEATWTLIPQEDQGSIPNDILPNMGYLWLSNSTFFDRTLHRKLIGPVTDVEWQALKALPNAGPYWRYRVRGDHLLIFPTPSVGVTNLIAFEYATSFAVTNADGTVRQATFQADTDVSVLPEKILKKALAYRWKELKGLPYASEQDRYFGMLNNYIARDGTKRTYNMAGPDLEQRMRPTIYAAAAPPPNNQPFLDDGPYVTDG
jgi:hypothetical protein